MNYKSKFTGKQIDDGIDKANSAYQKPQNGIPPEDLSEGVQNSLDKIEALPDHIVTDANYVHTDNNYTTEEKTKLGNTYTIEQTNAAIEQAKEDVSWEAEEYDITEAGGIGTVSHPRGRVVYFSSVAVSYIRISPLPHNASTGISFKVIGTPTEDTDNFVRISARGSIIFRTSNRPTIFKAGVTYKVEYTYISHDNLSCVYLEAWSGGTTTVAYTGSYNDLSNKPTIPTVPTNVSAFTNDAGYITKTVNDLVNYYLKSDTYTKTEVQQLISAIQQFTYQVVSSLPTASADTMNKIYLVPSADPQTQNVKDEYITIDNGTEAQTRYTWEQIGSTEIDLSGYYTSQQTDAAITAALNAALANYTTTAALTLLLAGKQDVINDLSDIRSGASAGATAYQKPAGGIPKTDLAQGVQDSLDKADTALQEDTLYVKVNNNGHEYVDLGLPSGTLWAKCNVGADAETGYGNYYMYGKGARQYNSSDSPYTGTEDPLDLSVDTARQVLGGSWKMPTQVQMQELIDNTTYEFTTINGVNGAKFTAQNGNYVFIPAAGYWGDGSQNDVGDNGDYWGSSPNGSNNACYLFFGDGYNDVGYDIREYGYSVRGVILPEKTQLKQDLDNKQNTLVSGTNIKTINNESILGGGNINIDISGKEDVTNIVAPVNATDATLPITTLATEVGKYYRIDVEVETLAVTLPVMENVTTTKTVVLYLTGGTTPAVTISSTAPTGGTAPDVYYQDGFKIEAGKTYEVNCLWNGVAWIVASVEIFVTNNGGE